MEDFHHRDIKEIYRHYVQQLIATNLENRICNDQSVFSRCNNPRLLYDTFINKLFDSMHCCLEIYIISLLYLKRINSTAKGIITKNSVKSLIIASMMLSQKYFDEICYKTKFYAQIADISESDMNFLEVEFLCTIHFSIAVFPFQYKVFYRELQGFSQRLHGVSIPNIRNVGTDDCPVLKYVLEDDRKHRELLNRDRVPYAQPVYSQAVSQPVYSQAVSQPLYSQPPSQPLYSQHPSQPLYSQPLSQPPVAVYPQPHYYSAPRTFTSPYSQMNSVFSPPGNQGIGVKMHISAIPYPYSN